MFPFLRKIPLFAELPEEDLNRLCQVAEEINLPAGKDLFAEGDPGDKAYVVHQGQVEILKSSGGRNVLLSLRGEGEVIGEIALLESSSRTATVRAHTDCRLISIKQNEFLYLLDNNPAMARSLLHTVSARLRATESVVNQSEKMAQIGTLTAGIAHDLSNPAAAAQRGAEQLSGVLEVLQNLQFKVGQFELDQPQLDSLLELESKAYGAASQPVTLSSIERSDRQDEIEDWLDQHQFDKSLELAPLLAELGCRQSDLEKLTNIFAAEQWKTIVTWWGTAFHAYSLLAEISLGTTRIGEIVKALKSYVYHDQAPLQLIDVQEGLDNTLVMMRSKLKAGITIQRSYVDDLPRIQAYGSELNQVWTNLIDNAIDVVGDSGKIIIRTRSEKDWVIVEIEDNGPGIPPEVQSKVFRTNFTTKPPGKGTGLGLDISQNIVNKHTGTISFHSQPGKTIFRVCLPVNFETTHSQPPA